jgi:RNA polymerase sigma factor for flagellar operon FliA
VVDLENKFHRTPTDLEIAEHLGISTADLRETYSQLNRTQVTALEELTLNQHDDNLTLLDTVTDFTAPDPEEVLIVRELVSLLARGISRLPRSEAVVLYLYYVAQKTLAEIAKELGVTESQIYHLRSSSLTNLREGLSAG